MSKKVAIIGASYLQLPLVEKAKEMGIETHCFAWKDDAVCENIADYFYPISVTDKESILEICKKVQIDAITSIASDIAVPTICYVAEHMELISNSYAVAQNATDKYLMRKCFKANGVSSPLFYSNGDPILSIVSFPLIVKPTDRSGSRGVTMVNNRTELLMAIKRAEEESFSKQYIVEEYIEGIEVSVETISWEGEHYILTITDKVTTGAPYFVEIEHHQPSQLDEIIQQKIRQETIKALGALNIEYGAGHVELKIDNEGNVFLIEIGARMGGDFIGSHLVPLSTGYDYLKAIINISLGQFDQPVINKMQYSGIFFICKETEKLLSAIDSKKHSKNIVKKEILDGSLKEVFSSADRSGYYIYQSETSPINVVYEN
ncbi:MAG: ATP-grasp domain-containing protein [Dysgonomonas sp.]|nr:ATP-grasp domain-containing protein [Dysgonomonas sp.]